jgi:hypothetical protein
MTVLDALVHIQRHHDRSLAFRYACRLGMCGTCTVMVNEVPRWACRTSIERLGIDTIRIAPLRFCRSSRMCWWTTNRSSPVSRRTIYFVPRQERTEVAPISPPHASAGPSIRTSVAWALLRFLYDAGP